MILHQSALYEKIVHNHVGKPTEDAERLFANEAVAKKAMNKHKQNLQHPYVELFEYIDNIIQHLNEEK